MTILHRSKKIVISTVMLALVGSMSCSTSDSFSDDGRKVIDAYNKTALGLYQELKQDAENLVISPYSIGTAMAMAFSGARGETEKEMAKVLNQIISRERIESANAQIHDRMKRFEKGKDVMLLTANALCLTPDSALVHQAYKELLRAKYHAEMFRAQDVGPINAWVEKKTQGKIDKILEGLNPNSVCVLLNAIYFKGLWASQFDKKLTRPGDFYISEDKTVSVPMMHQTSQFALERYGNSQAILLPYKGKSLAMVVILPKEMAGLAKIEKELSLKSVRLLLNNFEKSKPEKVALSMPRFKIEFGDSLIPAFQALGMKLAFSVKDADFGGITGRDNALGLIWISQIQHKAFLEVNEEGSEAAAATAVEFATKSIPKVTRFEVKRPFVFLLVDTSTNAILFIGRVKNPLKSM